jgi:uncharacterized OB-fold protein
MNLKETIFKKFKDGIFINTFCPHCKKQNWPPSNNCRDCFKKTIFKKIENKGILLEMSYSHIPKQENFFGIGYFSGIRILGTIVNKNLKVNDSIAIHNIKIINDKISLEFKKAKN